MTHGWINQRYADEFVVHKTEGGLWEARLTTVNGGDSFCDYTVMAFTRKGAIRRGRRLRDKGNKIHLARKSSREVVR